MFWGNMVLSHYDTGVVWKGEEMEKDRENVGAKKENGGFSKKILWGISAVLIVGIAAAVIVFGGFLDPCRKGHSFAPTETGCICSECDVIQAHNYEVVEDHCRCYVCGYETDEHKYRSQEKEFVCEHCGYAVNKVDYLCTYLLENGDFYRATYWLRAEVKEYEYELGYCERDNKLIFYYKSEGAWDTSLEIEMDIETGVCKFDYFENFVTGLFNAVDSNVKGTFKAENYKKEQSIPNTVYSGSFATDSSFVSNMKGLAGKYVWMCLETTETLLRDLEITLADIGFDKLK